MIFGIDLKIPAFLFIMLISLIVEMGVAGVVALFLLPLKTFQLGFF